MNCKKLWITSLLLLFSIYPIIAANEGSISGTLIDVSTNKPIDFADLMLFKVGEDNPILHTFPQKNGYFILKGVKAGNYNFISKLIGYDVFIKNGLHVAEGQAIDLGTIALKPLEIGLSEVEVVANRKQVIYKLDKKVIEASGNLMATGGTAVDILENTPSIRVDAEGNVTFRGSTGFAVYVNGKPSVFSGSQALEQIPSGHIKNIEIITTPSARYDTEGDVGIINIITKRSLGQGLSGMVDLSGSTQKSRNLNFLLTKQMEHSRWYLGGSWSDKLRKSDFDQEKTTTVRDTTTTSLSTGPRESKNYNYAMKFGWQYEWQKTSFAIDLEGGKGGRNRDGDLNYTDKRSANGIVYENSDFFSRDKYRIHEWYGTGTLSFNHKFNEKGHELNGSFYLKYGGDALEYFQSDLFDKNNVRQQGHRAWETEHRWTTRTNLDYSLPFSSTGRFEAGYQYSSYLEDGNYKMQFFDPEIQQFYWRDDIYNDFYFMNGIHSMYAIVANSWNKFEYQIGLREEYIHRVLDCSIAGTDRTYDHFDFFPSLHLGYTFPYQQSLYFAYSRRITRPRLFYMEPYITFRDFYSAEKGNPDIKEEYINSFEMNYKKAFGQNSVSATVFHRFRKNKIERLRVPYHTSGITLDSMANVGNDYSTGVELNAQIQTTPWWNININGSFYHYRIDNKIKELGGEDESSTNYDFMLNNGLDLGKYTRLQLDGNFIGPSVTTQGRQNAFWYMNFSVRQQMMKRKVTATLAFRDVFNSARYTSTITNNNLKSVTHIRPNYPLITLSVSYTFNNFKRKEVKQIEDHDLFEGTHH